jgi:thiamine-phosphate pyrophosphorylase
VRANPPSRLPSPLLPILDPAATAEPLLEVLLALAAGGAAWVEYRDKAAGDRLACERAARLVREARRLGIALLVNDRVDVALAAGADGVHLGQEDLPAAAARRLLGDEAIIGISVDTVAEARAAADLPIDYVAIGPVFATATKPDAGPVVGVAGVAAAAAAIDKPIVAVGGIDARTAPEVIAAGAECVAVVAALFGSGGVEACTSRLIEAAARGFRERPD